MPFSQGVAATSTLIFFIFAALMTAVLSMIFLSGLFTDAVRLESHWGGLGGGVGGWTMSRPLASLMAAVAFGLIAAFMAGGAFANSSERLKEKYAPVVRLLDQRGGKVSNYDVRNHKLYIAAVVPDASVKDRIFDEIKLINPSQDDILADINTPQPAKAK